ncbi:LytR/AlgR family response regulator transcription factor [Roseivirga misakiensis]|uniref:DNA-binding response regulator n=1 Tax=Roseivirga misakiensis TaxID=1563681 RepID=A0A1E5T143_9BACT|nr:LytTR family DNA-binding domain-containing protein [Roseivirga misakiensis]OEK05098.1 DNA-binding response regulator [Roseivirga misakiensis]
MDKITCLIVDDEPLAIEILEEYVKKVPWLSLKGVFDAGMDVIEYLNNETVDLIFLDIQMPDLSGIQVAELTKGKCDVIFTTAYNEYAVEGFELAAKDYLLKPISFERFLKSVQRLQVEKEAKADVKSDYIFVKVEYKIKKIRLDEIQYIEGMKDYLRIVLIDEKVMTLQSFSKLMPALPSDRFIRVHKSFVVSIDAIDSVEKGKIRINDQLIPISETYKEAFNKVLKDRTV